jgi:metal-responsive CopG/Arc/MetJ family transcriptional regulator
MRSKITTKRVSLDFPSDLLEKVDNICKEQFISKRKWFIDATIDKLEKENSNKIEKIVRG